MVSRQTQFLIALVIQRNEQVPPVYHSLLMAAKLSLPNKFKPLHDCFIGMFSAVDSMCMFQLSVRAEHYQNTPYNTIDPRIKIG